MSKIAYILDNKENFWFKTEQEFKEDYGPSWRKALPATWPTTMDYLFSQELNTFRTDNAGTESFWITDHMQGGNRSWKINVEMLLEKGVFRTVDISLRGAPVIDTTKLTGYRDYSSILKL